MKKLFSVSSEKKLTVKNRLLILGLCIAIIFSCSMSVFSSLQTKKQPDFDSYTHLLFTEQLSADTIGLNYMLANPDAYGITSPPVTLGSLQESDNTLTRISCENMRAVLQNYDYESLSVEQQLLYDILHYTLTLNLEGCEFYYYEEPLGAINGIQAELPILLAEYSFRSPSDIETYLTLLSLVPDYFSQIIDFEERKASKGLFMSTFAADNIINQISSLLSPPAFSCLSETFSEKLSALPGLSESQHTDYIARHEAAIQEYLIPAYKGLCSALSRLRDTGVCDGRLCQFPQGKAYYTYLVKRTTASMRSVEELNSMISKKRLSDLSELKEIINNNPNILSDMTNVTLDYDTPEAMLEHLKYEMQTDFPAPPNTAYTVKTVSPALQSFMSPAFYLTAPIDARDENHIYINPKYEHSDLELFTTLAHEGYPGHLYETVSSYEKDFSPLRYLFRFGGYTEGWATYTEMQSYQYAGLDETVARALQLNASATLSLYASIDIGIHYEDWNRDIVLEFLSDHGITSVETADHIYELIVETPANYLKYYIGYLEFLELKKEAQTLFSTDYNDKAFHQLLLEIGPAPFPMIRKYMPIFLSNTLPAADFYSAAERSSSNA